MEQLTETSRHVRVGRGDRHKTPLYYLSSLYFDIEHLRVAQDVRRSHLALDQNPFADDPIYEDVQEHLKALQHILDLRMMPFVKEHPCWTEFGLHVKGCGLHLMALIMGLIRDITPFTTVSKLWYLCGLAVIEGHAQYPVKGTSINYNPHLKSVLLGRLGTSLIRSRDPFAGTLYQRFKAEEEAKAQASGVESKWLPEREVTLDGHIRTIPGHFSTPGSYRRAVRRLVKIWVACLWEVWRNAEGLPIRLPYVIEKLGHTHVITPAQWVAYNQAAKANSHPNEETQISQA